MFGKFIAMILFFLSLGKHPDRGRDIPFSDAERILACIGSSAVMLLGLVVSGIGYLLKALQLKYLVALDTAVNTALVALEGDADDSKRGHE